MQRSGQQPRRDKVGEPSLPAMRQSFGSRLATLVRGSSTTNIDHVGEHQLVWCSRSPNIRLINRRKSSPGLLPGSLDLKTEQELRMEVEENS